MIIEINNFGPISNVKLNLSNKLTVIYGDNNIGKSYALQIVYLVMKYLREAMGHRYSSYNIQRALFFDDTEAWNSNIFSRIKKIVDQQDEKNITELVIDEIQNTLKRKFLIPLLKSFENTFKSFKNTMSSDTYINISNNDNYLMIDLARQQININHKTKEILLKKTNSNLTKRSTSHKETIYYSDVKNDNFILSINNIITSEYFRILSNFNGLASAVHFLPASRSGIYTGMSAFSGIVAELSKNKSVLSKKIELPGLSEAISDYFITLTEIVSRGNVINQQIDSSIIQIDKTIESEILHGDIKYDRRTNSLLYIPEGKNISLSMDEVSSMVSEISPIIAFLRMILYNTYIKGKRGLSNNLKTYVFVEEPEAHLHPKNQIKLMEIFSELEKYNIILFMTSHSNYVFNKLNNLVIKGVLSNDNYSPIHFVQSNLGSISQNISMDEFGVLDTNFLDSTAELYSEREMLLLEKMKKNNTGF